MEHFCLMLADGRIPLDKNVVWDIDMNLDTELCGIFAWW